MKKKVDTENNQTASKPLLVKPAVMHSLSLTYFAENYLRFKDKDGNEHKLDDSAMEMLKMIEEAQKQGCSLRRVWMRTKYKWMMVKD